MTSPRLALLYSDIQIEQRVAELARTVQADYVGRDVVAVGVLKGARVFLADLVRKMNLDMRVEFVSVSSYGSGTESSGPPVVRVTDGSSDRRSGRTRGRGHPGHRTQHDGAARRAPWSWATFDSSVCAYRQA